MPMAQLAAIEGILCFWPSPKSMVRNAGRVLKRHFRKFSWQFVWVNFTGGPQSKVTQYKDTHSGDVLMEQSEVLQVSDKALI